MATKKTTEKAPAVNTQEGSKLASVITELERMFDECNTKLFEGKLVRPVIAVSPDKTKGAYGWCTTRKIWKSDTDEFYEINMCAEHLNRPILEVIGTLIHEMVHLDNNYKNIKDTCGPAYHNKKYKETAEAHGLIAERGKYGWSQTKPNPELEQWINDTFGSIKFELARAKDEKAKVPHRKYNFYMCPCCKKKIYSIYEIHATCTECDEEFVQYK